MRRLGSSGSVALVTHTSVLPCHALHGRYLRWIGVKAKLFNVGNARRQAGSAGVGANFFDAGNKDAISMREKLAMAVQDDMYKWLDDQATPSLSPLTSPEPRARPRVPIPELRAPR